MAGSQPVVTATGERILLVDDDPLLLAPLSDMLALKFPGSTIDTCGSATGALEMIAANDYDVIVSDIKMPQMDGLTLLEKVRELRPRTPILLISGHGDHDLAVKAITTGAYAFIPKPIDREYFLAWLRRAVHERRLGEEVKYKSRALELYARDLEQMVEERTAVLHDQEARWRVIFEQSVIGIAECDMEGRFVLVNERFCRIVGRSRESLLQQRLHDLIHSEDLSETRTLFERMVRGGEGFTIETRYRRPDASTVWVDNSISTIRDETGRPRYTLLFCRDISEQRQAEEKWRESEQRFRMFADHAPVLVRMSGPDKRCDYFNRPWLDFRGRTLEQELGDGWAEGLHPEDAEAYWAAYTTAFASREPFAVEYRLQRADGEYRWMQDKAMPCYTAEGEFIGYIGGCVDVTEQKRADEILRDLANAS